MIRVLGDRVLVALPPSEPEIVSTGGIVLVRDPELRAQTRGIVMQLGEKTGAVDIEDVLALFPDPISFDQAGRLVYADGRQRHGDWTDHDIREVVHKLAPAPFDVQVGDLVLFSAGDGEELSVDGIDYVILREADLLGVVEPLEKEPV